LESFEGKKYVCVCFAVSSGPSEVSSFWIPGFIYVWIWNPENSNLILQNERFFIRGKNHPMLEISSKLDYPTSQRNTFP
jgi:hypothetical protein